ncbi:MAG: YfjI family protein [Solirubrobacteraceae bacterium]
MIEPEFATVLKSTGRELSTLSPTLRSAWDGRPLALLTRTAPARATSAHISIIGHITQTELRRHTTTVEIANGFLNRFIFAAVRRVRLLPEGGDPNPLKDTGLGRYLTSVLKHAQTAGKVTFTTDARELWWQLYPQLTQPADGPLGQLTARAEAHTIRLALIYTLLDGQRKIAPEHLNAALALWDYASRSASWALGQTTGDPLAEQIHAALTRSPAGLTRTQIRDLCQRNLPAERVEQALHALAATGRAQQQRTTTGGRPAELWTCTPTPAA